MNKEFKEFARNSRESIEKGEIRVSKELSDYDLAVQYAIGLIGEKHGYPYNVTIDEIETEIRKFAPELLREEDTNHE